MNATEGHERDESAGDLRDVIRLVHGARAHLEQLALITDRPEDGVVEAADLLDGAIACLAPAIKRGASRGAG
ncbi:hypothetical protein LK996_01185 [Lysobacter sp. A6]|uniref:Histidine kinase n=1 Tax=Noviluteimonas lactosilytica TaxID=2888523 RepID=A0ABS8JDK8_9GAMM|nr:hypothetical protein [Lysobacter lactosilyticus]MCC8361698.1 hypothetical protein [Lysobacter lactosilyticus]